MELSWEGYLSIAVFAIVICVIILDLMHMTLAMLLGVVILLLTGIATEDVRIAGAISVLPIISIIISNMVIVRCLEPTNFFRYLASKLVLLSRGDGRLLLLYTFCCTVPLCALLTNTTVVILFTPLLIAVARLYKMPSGPLVIFLVFIANTAGLLTLVGGIPTFLVGNALGIGFFEYLRLVGPGASMVLAAVLAAAPVLFPTVWKAKVSDSSLKTGDLMKVRIRGKGTLALLLSILTGTAVLYLVGEYLPIPISPVVTAISSATLTLVVVHSSGLDDFSRVIRGIDWETIIFFDAVFVFIASMESSGVFASIGLLFDSILGSNALLSSLMILLSIGLLSGILPNIPLTAVMIPTLINYLFHTGFLSGAEAAFSLTEMSSQAQGIFLSLLFGITLGGNGTILGAVPNLIAAGVCRTEGDPLSFAEFFRIGMQMVLFQFAVAAIFIFIAFFR